jgi:spoIIIJ-associated protein
MREVERSAPSVEEAVEAALDELGVSEQEASVEVVQEARGGLLGIGAQPAIVRVTAPDRSGTDTRDRSVTETDGAGGDDGPVDGAEHHAASIGDRDADAEGDQADIAADFIEDILERMGIRATVEIADEDGGSTYVEIWGEEDEDAIGALIGRRGSTLDGLQELVRSVVQRHTGERCTVLVDVEDYRKRRRDQVLRRADEAVARVRRTGKPVAMEPMSSYERKLVHDAIASIGGLDTLSEGQEPNRRVVVRVAGSIPAVSEG